MLLSMYELRLGHVEDAFAHAKESLTIDPHCFATWKLLGAAMARRPYRLSELAFLDTIPIGSLMLLYLQAVWRIEYRRDVEIPVALLTLSFAKRMFALRHFHRFEYQKAANIFKHLLIDDPDSLDGLDTYSDILYLAQRPDDLHELLRRCESIQKSHPVTYHVAGNHYALGAIHEKAVLYFIKAARCDTRIASEWILAGQQFLELRRPEASISCFLNATSISNM